MSDCRHVLFNRVPFPPECSCGTRMPDGNVQDNFNQHLVDVNAPVSDTRREDVAREMGYRLRTVAAYYRMCGKHGEEPDPAFIEREIQSGTDRVLAVLPAPPVVDEAEIVARALDEAAAEFAARLPDGTPNGRAYNSHQVAQMLTERAARLRGATR